jgi:hypothetical protein
VLSLRKLPGALIKTLLLLLLLLLFVMLTVIY